MADPFSGEMAWNMKIKFLSDDDLMDMWAETQALETALDLHIPGHDFPGSNFEQSIVQELTLRMGQRPRGGLVSEEPFYCQGFIIK